MKNKKFDIAQAALMHSQNMLDKLRQPQQQPMQAPQGQPQQGQPQAPQQAPQAPVAQAPQPQAPQTAQEPTANPIDLIAKSGQAMQDAFTNITKAFTQTEEKKAQETKDLQTKFNKDLSGIKESIRKIVEE